jgi:hypothetical protein
VRVTTADVQDQDGGIPLVNRLVRLCPWIATVVVDGGDKSRFLEAVQTGLKRMVESSGARTSREASFSCRSAGASSKASAP